jgi:alpha-tubulin suppressor-like RCC1 family protein
MNVSIVKLPETYRQIVPKFILLSLIVNMLFFILQIDVIAAAVGPSGYNSEYLFKLRDYMTLKGLNDKYLLTLSQDVSLRMGPWRDRIPIGLNKSQKEIIELLNAKLEKSDQTTIDLLDSNIYFGFDNRKNDLSSFILAGQLLGWGSNEYQQLGAHMTMSHPNDALQSFATDIGLVENFLNGNTHVDSSAIQENSENVTSPDQLIQTTNNAQKDTNNIIRQTQSQVLSGGAFSAFIDSTGTLTTWGKGIDFLNIDQSKITQPIEFLSKLSAALIVSLDNIIGAAMGHEHMLLLQQSGWVVAIGDNKSRQCEGPSDFVRNNPTPTYERVVKEGTCSNNTDNSGIDGINSGKYAVQPLVKVLKLAAGVRHSAAITMDGYLHVWGTGAAAKIDSLENINVWRPNDDVKLIDVDCGMHHTVAIDELGRVWSFGDDRFGSLGRSTATPKSVGGFNLPVIERAVTTT